MADQNSYNTLISDFIDFIDARYKGLLITDEQRQIIKVNDQFKGMFHLFDKEDCVSEIERLFSEHQITPSTEYFYDEDKNQINVSYQCIKADGREFHCWLFEVVSIENTRLKLLETIVHFCQDGIHAVNPDGNLIVYNEAQGKIDHYDPDTVLGKHVSEIYALDYESSLLLKVLKTKEPIENIRQGYYTKNGTFVDCVTSVIPLYYHGKIFGSAAIVRDYNGILQTIENENISVKTRKTSQPASYESSRTRYSFDDIITVNSDLAKSIQAAKRAAKTDSNILIIGETGTGKEMFAQSIHAYSDRRDAPFLAINCAAIPETLLESLLFGTTKGTFTGAADKAGLFEEAENGTIFLDEINSMSLFLQSKLLRVLEERTVSRLGSNKMIPVNARIISSCNENPAQAIAENHFRSDLFYRLSVVYIVIPCLRVRKDDILILTKYFIDQYNQRFLKNIRDVAPDVKKLFLEYGWPGNVRQLRHLLESAMNVVDDREEYIQMVHLPQYIMGNDSDNVIIAPTAISKTSEEAEVKAETAVPADQNIFDELKEKEREIIVQALTRNNGNIAKAAREMGMSRQKLYYKLKKYNLK